MHDPLTWETDIERRIKEMNMGDLPLDETIGMMDIAKPNDEQIQLMSDVMEVFVGVFGEDCFWNRATETLRHADTYLIAVNSAKKSFRAPLHMTLHIRWLDVA